MFHNLCEVHGLLFLFIYVCNLFQTCFLTKNVFKWINWFIDWQGRVISFLYYWAKMCINRCLKRFSLASWKADAELGGSLFFLIMCTPPRFIWVLSNYHFFSFMSCSQFFPPIPFSLWIYLGKKIFHLFWIHPKNRFLKNV